MGCSKDYGIEAEKDRNSHWYNNEDSSSSEADIPDLEEYETK